MNKLKEIPAFSSIINKGSDENPDIFVSLTPLGRIIQNRIINIKKDFNNIKAWDYIIMPDHIHFIINIFEDLDDHLGKYLATFKRNIFEDAYKSGLVLDNCRTIFDIGFNDQFLKRNRSLQQLKNYIYKNPYYRWIRQKHPEYFTKLCNQSIINVDCSLYGNLELLESPFLFPVVVHRKDLQNSTVMEKKWEEWKYAVLNGGTLVGAFISDEEKRVRDFAIENNANIIFISNRKFEGKDKPSGFMLDLCNLGNILIVSPDIEASLGKRRNFRSDCLYMNDFAEKFCRLYPAKPLRD